MQDKDMAELEDQFAVLFLKKLDSGKITDQATKDKLQRLLNSLDNESDRYGDLFKLEQEGDEHLYLKDNFELYDKNIKFYILSSL